MTEPTDQDPNRKWKRVWRAFHSPILLAPAFLMCTAAAAGDVVEVIPKFGWPVGAALMIPLIVGIVISVLDFVPHCVRWLCHGHVLASDALARGGRFLQALSDRIAAIVADQ